MKNTDSLFSALCKVTFYCYEGIVAIIKDKVQESITKVKIEKFLLGLSKGQLLIVETNNCILMRQRDEFYKCAVRGSILLILKVEPTEYKLVCLFQNEKYEVVYNYIPNLKLVRNFNNC